MFIKKIHWLILLLIIAVSCFVRFYRLESLPPSLNWDEVSHAYTAWSLLTTGRDQWGSAFPVLNYRGYGDYPAVLDTYLTIVPLAVLGHTDFAVRFSHALAGVLVCLLGFISGYYYFKKPNPALLVALFLSFDPWTLFPSRAVFQSNFTVLFLSLGLSLYLAKKPVSAIIIWALSLLTYHNTRIFIPALLFVQLLKNYKNSKLLLTGLIIILISVGILLSPDSRARSSWVGIIDSGAIAGIEQARNQSRFPSAISTLIYNRPVYFVRTVTGHYLNYFSPGFLFFTGGSQYQFSLPGFGLLNWAELPFFYLGIIYFIRRKNYLFLSWLLLSPLPAAVTRDQSAVIRATTMLPVVMMTSVAGMVWLWHKMKNPARFFVSAAFICVYLLFLGQFSAAYLTSYSKNYSSSWQYGYHQLVDFIRPQISAYDRIIITKKYGEPHEFVLWYLPVAPSVYQSDKTLIWDYHDAWYWVNAFSKFRFINDWDLPLLVKQIVPNGRSLVIASPDNLPPNGSFIKQINFLNGQPAFIIKRI